MKKNTKILFIIMIPILLYLPSKANVLDNNSNHSLYSDKAYYVHHFPDPINVKTLNFYFPSQDILIPCIGLSLEVFRVYNSYSAYNGPFGIGWTFNYDIHVTEKNGYLEVAESGGLKNQYVPFELHDKFKNNIILNIIKAIANENKKQGSKKSAAYYKSLKSRLQREHDFYIEMKMKYLIEGSTPKVGKYISFMAGKNLLYKKETGYMRLYPNGKKEYFDKKGNLIKITDKFNNAAELSYVNGKLEKVTDSCGRSLKFAFNGKGKISTITDTLGKKLRYDYDDKDNLVRFIDVNGKETWFKYSDKHHMTKITYPDNVGSTINEYDKYGKIAVQIGPNKLKSNYLQTIDPQNKMHYWTVVTNSEGYWRRYDYYEDEYKSVTTFKDKTKKITKLDPLSAKPLSITDEKGTGVFFQYDSNYNLIRRTDSDGTITEYSYEPKFGQIESIATSDKENFYYHYNDNGEISWAYDNQGHFLKIDYYPNGKHSKVTNSMAEAKGLLDPTTLKKLVAKKKGNGINDVTILFSYDKYGFTNKIEKKGTSYILSEYDELGNIKKVEAKMIKEDKAIDKKDIVDDIRRTMVDVLAPLRPAGINLEI